MRLHPCKETNVGDQFLQGYRMITGLVARPWFLMEICSKQEIINIVIDPNTETAKIGLSLFFNSFVWFTIVCLWLSSSRWSSTYASCRPGCIFVLVFSLFFLARNLVIFLLNKLYGTLIFDWFHFVILIFFFF